MPDKYAFIDKLLFEIILATCISMEIPPNRNIKEAKQIVNVLVPSDATRLSPFVTSNNPQKVASMYGKSEVESPKYTDKQF